jgi:hypothetical protein
VRGSHCELQPLIQFAASLSNAALTQRRGRRLADALRSLPLFLLPAGAEAAWATSIAACRILRQCGLRCEIQARLCRLHRRLPPRAVELSSRRSGEREAELQQASLCPSSWGDPFFLREVNFSGPSSTMDVDLWFEQIAVLHPLTLGLNLLFALEATHRKYPLRTRQPVTRKRYIDDCSLNASQSGFRACPAGDSDLNRSCGGRSRGS